MFRPYMHIERYGSDAVQGIELGKVFVFPKLDGTNASLWQNEFGVLCAGSRHRQLSLENDNAGFFNSIIKESIEADDRSRWLQFFNTNPFLRLYGEWLIPHTLKTYRENAWNNFWVFDIYDDKQGIYLDYRHYSNLLDKYGIDYIPCISEMNNASYDHLLRNLQNNTFLIKDGEGIGEGIVIKNYNFVNRFGNTIWAKLVNNEFKTQNQDRKSTRL